VTMNPQTPQLRGQLQKRFGVTAFALFLAGAAIALFPHRAASRSQIPGGQSPQPAVPVPSSTSYIDVHTHIDPRDPNAAVEMAAKMTATQNAAKLFLLAEPYPQDDPARYDADVFLASAKKYPDKLAVLAGGATLNAMIIESARTGDSGPDVKQQFKERAEAWLRQGVAGFGELTAEHLSQPSSGIKDYEYAPPDHPLFLLLADIAAQHHVPIDLHMEAIPQTMPLPSDLSAPNPPELPANIAAFERLLDHNRNAKIIWAHAGADFTGFRTPDLCRRLLKAHANLYMEIKVDPITPGRNPLLLDGKIKPDWLKLFQDFPGRFVVGSDQHYGPKPPTSPSRWQATVLLLNQLPPDLRRKIGMENALKLYSGK
jgi:predicted TIM-barrel fold metal-dependent hydrolase